MGHIPSLWVIGGGSPERGVTILSLRRVTQRLPIDDTRKWLGVRVNISRWAAKKQRRFFPWPPFSLAFSPKLQGLPPLAFLSILPLPYFFGTLLPFLFCLGSSHLSSYILTEVFQFSTEFLHYVSASVVPLSGIQGFHSWLLIVVAANEDVVTVVTGGNLLVLTFGIGVSVEKPGGGVISLLFVMPEKNTTLSEAHGVSLRITSDVRDGMRPSTNIDDRGGVLQFKGVIPGTVYHDLYLGGKALVERENVGFDLTKSDLCPSFLEVHHEGYGSSRGEFPYR
ncbi:hypothetical protein Tco_1142322 [Tanacetum coccineum]